MLHVPAGTQSFGLALPSWGATRPDTVQGTSVTPGTVSFGSYTQLGSNLTADAHGIYICINNNNSSATARDTVLTIGIDEAGGASYADTIPFLLAGGAAFYHVGSGGIWYYFPLFIPAGSSVAAKAWSTVATAFHVGAVFMQKPMAPGNLRKGSIVEAIGISSQRGTAITLGTTNDGTWTSLGTTTKRLWWWQLGIQINSTDTTFSAAAIHMDMAVGDATNKDIIINDALVCTTTAEALSKVPNFAVEWPVPAGSEIWMRGQSSSSALDSYTVAAYGLGG